MTTSVLDRYSFLMNRQSLNVWGSLSLRQVKALTVANLKTRYRKTIAGFLWVLMNPLIMFGVQSLIFSHILKIEMKSYSIFLLSGLLPWIFISQTLEMCSAIFVNSGRLLKSYSLHPLVYLSAQVLDNIINFTVSLLILLLISVTLVSKPAYLLLLPLPILSLFLGVFSLAWLVATTHVFFRDTKFIISFILQILFFLTPVFYPADLLPSGFNWVVKINPLNHFIQPFRSLIHNPDIADFSQDCFSSLCFSVALLIIASMIWKRKRNELYFHL